MTSYCPWPGLVPAAPSNRDFEGGFATAMMLKDLRLAAEAAGAAKAETPLGEHARQIYEALAAEGQGGKDFSVIIEKLRGKL
jgi:3-hydroxyisobutyrate dehydrogenase